MRWLPTVVVLLTAAWALPAAAQEGHDEHPATGGGAAHAAEGGHGHGPHLGEDVSADTKNPAEFKTDLALFTLVVFGLLFTGLYLTAWPKITTALEEREAGIRRAIADAEKARNDAADMLKQHQAKLDAVQEEVKAILAEARRDAERTKADIMASANTEATATKNRAIAEIERAKDQALNELFDRMANQVAKATEQVVGRSITADDQNRYIREALAQVHNN
jgi:F-type H+-transporting ATPase subunit b